MGFLSNILAEFSSDALLLMGWIALFCLCTWMRFFVLTNRIKKLEERLLRLEKPLEEDTKEDLSLIDNAFNGNQEDRLNEPLELSQKGQLGVAQEIDQNDHAQPEFKVLNSEDVYLEQDQFTLGENARVKVGLFSRIKKALFSKENKVDLDIESKDLLDLPEDFEDPEFLDPSGVKITSLSDLEKKTGSNQ